jgi:hypothetical protein
MTNQQDAAADLTPESDRSSESYGEINEARFKAAPDEVRAGTDAALDRAFPGKD